MLIGNLPWIAVATVSLGLLQTTEAAPIRVTVVSHQEWLQPVVPMRFGHAMAGHMDDKIVGPGGSGPIAPSGRKPCPMHKKGGMNISDSLRKALGLPPVEPQPMHSVQLVHAAPPPPPFEDSQPSPPDGWSPKSQDFFGRLNSAVMALGDGEARIIAFVLGCGIGVLLRMLWVFFVLIGRGLREASIPAQDAEYTLVLQDEEQLPKYEVQPPTATQVEKEKALFKALEEAAFI